MAISKRKGVPRAHNGKRAYLTKRILQSAARKGIRHAAKETMEVMGYTIIARDGWVIRLYPDGQFVRISPIEQIGQD